MHPSTDPTEYPGAGGRLPDEDSPLQTTEGFPSATSEVGLVDEVTSAVAGVIDNTSRYLQEQGLKDMAEDVKNLIQRNPIPALLVGVGLGFLIGRAMGPRI